MGYVPGYANDIFISYAHIDNDATVEGKRGWVDFFEYILRQQVQGLIGREPVIFRDPQLRKFGKFSSQLAEQLSNSAVFICVLSPRYIESESCLHELGEFAKQGGTDRLIKIVKTAVDEESYTSEIQSLFAEIKDVLDFRFYAQDETSRLINRLQPEAIPDHIPAFVGKVDVIAQNVVELLKKLRRSRTTSTPAHASAADTEGGVASESAPIAVYLADTTRDRVDHRNEIISELRQFNYRVLPDQSLPQNADELIKAVRSYLEQAKLSVHLLGANYGVRPESEDRSVPHIQYDLAAEISRERQLQQIVWMPDGLTAQEANQRAFVDLVKNTSRDLLTYKLADLKTEIHKRLKPDQATGWEDEEGDPVNVCLLYHEQDVGAVKPLHNHLKLTEFFKVKLPLQEPSVEHHKQLLQASDAVLLYYGTADEDWFVNIWRLIQRHSSAGRTKPILAKGIYAGQPPTAEKNLLDSEDLVIIRNYGQFTPESLTPFVQKIRAAKGELR